MVRSPLFQSLGHTLFRIHELNKVVSGLDNSSAPIFKIFAGIQSLPVAFLMFNDSSTARTCPYVTVSNINGLLPIFGFLLNLLDIGMIFKILHCLALRRITSNSIR